MCFYQLGASTPHTGAMLVTLTARQDRPTPGGLVKQDLTCSVGAAVSYVLFFANAGCNPANHVKPGCHLQSLSIDNPLSLHLLIYRMGTNVDGCRVMW